LYVDISWENNGTSTGEKYEFTSTDEGA